MNCDFNINNSVRQLVDICTANGWTTEANYWAEDPNTSIKVNTGAERWIIDFKEADKDGKIRFRVFHGNIFYGKKPASNCAYGEYHLQYEHSQSVEEVLSYLERHKLSKYSGASGRKSTYKPSFSRYHNRKKR